MAPFRSIAVLRDVIYVIDDGRLLGLWVAVTLDVTIGLIGHQDVVDLRWRPALLLPLSCTRLLAHITQLLFVPFLSKYFHIGLKDILRG